MPYFVFMKYFGCIRQDRVDHRTPFSNPNGSGASSLPVPWVAATAQNPSLNYVIKTTPSMDAQFFYVSSFVFYFIILYFYYFYILFYAQFFYVSSFAFYFINDNTSKNRIRCE